MFKFFRKIRQRLLSENKFRKYLVYAVGEIILVVIGILIALYINTSREELQQQQYTLSIFEQIRKDLVNDSFKLGIDIKKIETTNRYIIDILANKIPDSFYTAINETTYDDADVRPLRSLCTDFVAFLPNTKGYDLLTALNNKELVNDSLTNSIMNYYTQLKTVLPEYNKVTVELSKRNIQDYKQYSWFENWALGIYDPRFIEYLQNDEENRKRLAEFYNYNSVNESYWKTLKQSTEKLIEQIDGQSKRP
ncbi:hypothetical protein [Flagellimonas beolgyonensis]|uniref:hypothetical protein n=1 Tax=Flagellimonas beolgyonensis TaxID=864064 RepID=UPI003D64A1D6